MPNIINTGIGMPLWHYAVIGPDGKPGGNPALMKQGIPVYTEVYRQAFGAMPSGEKFEALLLMNDIATKLQRGFFLPKGAPDEAAADLRRAYQALASDARSEATAWTVVFVAGTALLAAGVVWWLARGTPPPAVASRPAVLVF